MDLPGLITLDPHDAELATHLANIGGDSFLEENWTIELLSALPTTSTGADRTAFLSRAIIASDIAVGAPYGCVYCLEDGSAIAIATLKSELEGLKWSDLEKKAYDGLVKSVLSDEEVEPLMKQLERMEPVSQFDWHEYEYADDDCIHFIMWAVDPTKRGTGRFRQLVTPFFDYADEHGIPCYLEAYSDDLESLYNHIGFETVKFFKSPELPIVERAMMRRPRTKKD